MITPEINEHWLFTMTVEWLQTGCGLQNHMYMCIHCSQKAGLALEWRVSYQAVRLSPAATAASLYPHAQACCSALCSLCHICGSSTVQLSRFRRRWRTRCSSADSTQQE